MKKLKKMALTAKHAVGAAVAAVGIAASGMASAAVPAAASDAVSELVTDSVTFVASFWPLAIAVTVGFLWFRLFKRGTSTAT